MADPSWMHGRTGSLSRRKNSCGLRRSNYLFGIIKRFGDHRCRPRAIIGLNCRSVSDFREYALKNCDLACGACEPSGNEQKKSKKMRLVSLVFYPASFVLHIKEFVGYIDPATDKQQALTSSVKGKQISPLFTVCHRMTALATNLTITRYGVSVGS